MMVDGAIPEGEDPEQMRVASVIEYLP